MSEQIYAGLGRTILASAARTTSTNSGNLRDTTGGIPASDAIAVILNVTALTGAGPAVTLDVWVDTSPDGGTTWFEAFKFANVPTSTISLRIDSRSNGIGSTAVGTVSTVTTTGTAALNTNTVLARDQRVRWEILGATSAGSATFAVYAIVMPPTR